MKKLKITALALGSFFVVAMLVNLVNLSALASSIKLEKPENLKRRMNYLSQLNDENRVVLKEVNNKKEALEEAIKNNSSEWEALNEKMAQSCDFYANNRYCAKTKFRKMNKN